MLLAAVPLAVRRWDLLWASWTGPWHRFAELTTASAPSRDERAHDEPVQLDPVLHELPGLSTYGWVRALREPAYRAARRSRGSD